MAARTTKITLGDTEYTVHAFNVGELETVADILEGPPRKAGFAILGLALQRAEPAIDTAAFAALEIGMDEISLAVPVIMKLAGLEQKSPNPPGAPGVGA